MRSIVKFIKETAEELRKVVWPSREVVIRHTATVIITIVVAMLIISAIDLGLSQLIQLIVTGSK